MQLGVDFDGTIIRYAVCAKSDGGDGHTITTTETLDGAKHELQLIINREKKKKYMTDMKFWIMKQTFKFEKMYEIELEADNENN
jgi:uncharacterized HAD superfamily protein